MASTAEPRRPTSFSCAAASPEALVEHDGDDGSFVVLGHALEHSVRGHAEYQNRIILHENTLNLPVVAQQPHSDPNYEPRRAAGA